MTAPLRTVWLAAALVGWTLSASVPRAETAEAAPAPAAALAPEAAAPTAPVVAPDDAATGQPDEAAIRAMLRKEAEAAGLPPEIAEAVTSVESGFNARAVGGVGEIGLMQVLPSTARMLGFSEPLPRLFDPATNIRYGVRYLSQAWKLTGEDICGTVMKYRAGHGESRFSHRSVAYCVRVREILASRGFKVTGTVPVATFGEIAGRLGPVRGVRRLANGRVRMRFNWASVDGRRKALDRAGASNLSIMD
ncbi:transglycosylase SLT domain-containing protein [Methylopila sp. M107]|uniref:lytic transglycosylase domain-containing protein n=1 Tax=Methylopila sp. M107 TaxID=1101190 RepID=UPI000382BEF1|nr:transglycosylase SLT domain-containing protein [Methylopila sp. M107]